MTYTELLSRHQTVCQECRKGFCTPATVLKLMADEETLVRKES